MEANPFRIYLWGPPSCGKSRTAARLFADLKDLGVSPIELVGEAAKEWAWAGRTIAPWDQWVLLGEQLRREYELLRNDVSLITDCPLGLNYIYAKKLATPAYNLIPQVALEFDWDFPHTYNFLLTRGDRPYDPKGRYQTQEESDNIGEEIKKFLDKNYKNRYKSVLDYSDLLTQIKEIVL